MARTLAPLDVPKKNSLKFYGAMPDSRTDLTVVVRTAGRSAVFLRRALASLGAQVRAPKRVVVINDGQEIEGVNAEVNHASTAELPIQHLWRDPVAQPLPNRSNALNRGIAACDTRWIAFLDDDDTWSPHFLERVAPMLLVAANRPNFGGVVVQTEVIYERFNAQYIVQTGRQPFNPDLRAIELATLAVENKFTLNALVVRRDVFDVVGGYREDLAVLEDWEFNVRAAARFDFEVIPEPLARYHLRGADDPSPNTASDEMVRTGARIRNEWLRADLAAGRVGLGQLTLAGESRGVAAELSRWSRWRSRIAKWLSRTSR